MIDVKTKFDGNPAVAGSESEFVDVFTNLIINSVEAMDGNGKINISTHVEGDWITIACSDTGEGMVPDTRLKCLEPFFTTKGPQRLGLGLSVVHGAIQRHKGSMEIESAPGQGTTVTIRLHVLDRAGELISEKLAQPSRLTALKVLAIDDDPTSLKFVQLTLSDRGHFVETALTGESGLAKFASGGFDLVITDRAMPDMSGDQVAAMAKRITPSVRVILLTGFGDIMEEEEEHPRDVDMVVSKPVSEKELHLAVAQVMSGVDSGGEPPRA